VVDDEPLVRSILARQLRSLGYLVVEAGSARVALALAAEQSTPFDVVLSDIVMPEMNGTELAARLLAREHAPAVVLMSAYAPSGVVAIGSTMRAVPLLQKPMEIGQLAEVLERTLTAGRLQAVPAKASGAVG
jgi:CheY-like chemotaxis protein